MKKTKKAKINLGDLDYKSSKPIDVKISFKKWLKKTEEGVVHRGPGKHRPQPTNVHRIRSYQPPSPEIQPVGVKQRDPSKPAYVRKIEDSKKNNKKSKKSPIDVMFTGK